MALMKIGEFAKELGVSVQQLRDMDKTEYSSQPLFLQKGPGIIQKNSCIDTPTRTSPTERSSAIVGSARMDRRTTWKPRSRM